MSLSDVLTLLFMILGAGGALLVAFHPNILYSAIALIASLLSVAGLYGILGADFLAAVQLIIYVGGIIVVILFAIMMSENVYRTRFIDTATRFVVPALVALPLAAALFWAMKRTPWPNLLGAYEKTSTLIGMGRALIGPYALVFQYVSIVLLFGLIGAVVVARPSYQKEGGGRR